MTAPAKDLPGLDYLRLGILGDAKVGKTTTVVKTCTPPIYIINCDDSSSLRPVKDLEFDWDFVRTHQQMENALTTARRGAEAGKYKTVIWDTLTVFARRLLDECANATDNGKGPDGRRYWPEFEKRLFSITERMFELPCHVIINMHYVDVKGQTMEGQLEKTGEGIFPMLGGSARKSIPTLFHDIVFMEKRKDKRIFVINPIGVYGPGCRNLPGSQEIDADIKGIWELMQKAGAK